MQAGRDRVECWEILPSTVRLNLDQAGRIIAVFARIGQVILLGMNGFLIVPRSQMVQIRLSR